MCPSRTLSDDPIIGGLAGGCGSGLLLQSFHGIIAVREAELHIEQLPHHDARHGSFAVSQDHNPQLLLRHQSDLADHAVNSASVRDQLAPVIVAQKPAEPVGLKMSALPLGLLPDRHYCLWAPNFSGCGRAQELLALVSAMPKL